MKKNTDPMKNKEDVKNSSDNKIDQDFKGFPDGQAKENLINPKSEEDKKTAAVNIKDGEKVNKAQKEVDENEEVDEEESDGSGGAFEGTESMRDDD